jgi:ABC-type nitrate/sulfonate/bicarbonate transport system permease component
MRWLDRLSGIAVLAAILALWEAAARAGLISPDILPAPSVIAQSFWSEIAAGELTDDLLITTRRFAISYAIASVVGCTVGFALGRWTTLHAALEPIIEFLRPMPVVAILPIALLVLGLGDVMACAVIAFGAGWIVMLNAMDGIRGVDPVLLETGRTFRVSGTRLFWTIVVPAAAPHVFTGLRVSLSIALIITVVIEMIVGLGGLGDYIRLAQGALQTPETYAGIALVGLLGYALARLFGLAERRLMAWHRGFMHR